LENKSGKLWGGGKKVLKIKPLKGERFGFKIPGGHLLISQDV